MSNFRNAFEHVEVTNTVEAFVYRQTQAADTSNTPEPTPAKSQAAPTALPIYTEEQAQARERRALERGLREGEEQAQARFNAALVQSQAMAASIVAEFERERPAYFRRVEGEVVRLALAIARKILHREAQMDPMLLAGVARVALEQLAAGSVVRLRVHPSQIESWREFFSVQSGLNLTLEWMGDTALDPAQCRLETSVGSTMLSLQDQLGEIEQGFFDLLAETPGQTG